MTDAYILVIPAPAPWINANDRRALWRKIIHVTSCDNGSAPGGATNALRGLTHSLDTARRG